MVKGIWQWAMIVWSILGGSFLILDSFFWHSLTMDYSRLPFSPTWLNPYIDHWMTGAVGLVFGLVNLYHKVEK